MLQNIRDKMQGLVAGGIAVVIALTFALWGVQNYLQSGGGGVVAKINGEEITQQELHMAYEQAKRIQMLYMGNNFLDQESQAKLKRESFNKLVEKKILYQAEKEMGLGVTRGQLLATVIGMPVFQVNGRFSPARFERAVQNIFGSEQAFFLDLEQNFLRAQLAKTVVDSSFILPNEIEFIKKILKQRRDFGYFTISPKSFLKDINVTKEDIKKYYDENKAEFLLPEKVSINYLELISDKLSVEKPTKEKLKAFYQDNIASFSIPKEWRVKKVLMPLSSNAESKDIEDAKKKMDKIALELKDKKKLAASSEIKITTSWLKAQAMPKDLLSQVNALKVGDISSVFHTKDGLFLVKILAIKPSKAKSYASVSKQVKDLYKRELISKAFSEASDKLSDLVYTNPDNLDVAAVELGLKVKYTKIFDANDKSKTGVLANPKVVKAAFSDIVLKERYNSNLIEITPGHLVVLRIKDYVPEKVRPLSGVKSIIVAKLKGREADKKTKLVAEEVMQKILKGENESKLSKQHKLEWKKVASASYDQKGKKDKLVDAAFELAKPEKNNVSAKVVELGGDIAVLRLDKVYLDSSSKEDSKAESILKSLANKLGRFDYKILVDSFRDQAKIKIMDNTLN